MNGTRSRWLALLLAALVVGAAACKSSSTSTATPQVTSTGVTGTPSAKLSGTITVGASTALTGVYVGLGQPEFQGYQLAVEDLNAQGGLLGKEVKLVSADDASQPSAGTTNVRHMITDEHAVAIFGPATSNVTAALESLVTQYKVPLFSAAGTDISVTTTNFTKYMFEMIPNTVMEGNAIGAYMCQQPYTRYATIADDINFGHSKVEGFLAVLKKCKPDLQIVKQEWTRFGGTNFEPYISAVLGANPQVVFAPFYAGEMLAFTKQAQGFGLFDKVKVVAPYDTTPLEAFGTPGPAGAVDYQHAPFYAIDTPQIKAFAQAYHAKYGDWPADESVTAYVSVQTWAEGVKKAGTFDGTKVADALSGATVPTIVGNITLRACDHQAELPMYVGVLAPNASYGFDTITNLYVAQPSNIMLTCAQAQALQPK